MRDYNNSNSESKCEVLCEEKSKRIEELEKEIIEIKNEIDQIREIHSENKLRFDGLDKKIDILDIDLKETLDVKLDRHENRTSEKIDELFQKFDELFDKFALEREDRLLSNKDIEIDIINTINKISQLDGLIEEKGKRDKDRKLMLFYPIIVAIVTVIASTITRLF